MKKKLFFKVLIVVFIMTRTISFSQSSIEGEIVDSDSKKPLFGVNVFVKGTEKSTTTDFDGFFSLSNDVDFPCTLEISSLGFETKEVIVKNKETDLKISLRIDDSLLKDLLITANKRIESAQKVPMSVSVLPQIKLRRLGAKRFKDYANGIPNLAFSPSGNEGYGRQSNNVAIRGISGKNTTAMYLDETPLPENIGIRLLDVNQIEILKGPQGTLYGSRNMGGAIKTITNQPNTNGIEGSIKIENSSVKEGDQNYNIEGILNIPLGNKLALRFGGFYDFESGIFDTRINNQANVLNKQPVVTVTNGIESIDIKTDGCDICLKTDKENIDDKEEYGINFSLGYFPNQNISIVPKVIIQDLKGSGYDFAESETGQFIKDGNFDQIRASGIPESFNDKWEFYSLTGKIDVGKGSFISSTSFLNRNILEKEDSGEIVLRLYDFWDKIWNPSDGLYNTWAFYMSKEVFEKQLNQELRFQSNFGNKFEFTAGVFYTDNNLKSYWNSEENAKGFISYVDAIQYDDYIDAEIQNTNPNVPLYEYFGHAKNTEFAAFGEFYYKLTPKLKATLGFRYFNAEIILDTFDWGFSLYDGITYNDDGTPDYESSRSVVDKESKKEDGIIPKFNLTYDITDNQLIYINAAKGFRLGSVNDIVNLFLSSEELIELGYQDGKPPKIYNSDYLWNYELGYKGKSPNGKWVANLSIFYNTWENLQQIKSLLSGYAFTTNVGGARSYGLEFEVKGKLTNNFTIEGGYGYLIAEMSEDVSFLGVNKGDKIFGSSPHTANFSIEYNKKLSGTKTLYGNIMYQFVGERVGSYKPEVDTHLVFAPYSILNTRIGLQIGKYDIAVFANNLTNTFANYGSPNAHSGDLIERPRYVTNRPITIGASVRYKFN